MNGMRQGENNIHTHRETNVLNTNERKKKKKTKRNNKYDDTYYVNI